MVIKIIEDHLLILEFCFLNKFLAHSVFFIVAKYLILLNCALKNGYTATETYPIAQGTLLNVMWRPGWEGSLGENGCMCVYVWLSPFAIP